MTLGITSRSILDLEEDLMHKYAVEKIKSKYADLGIRENRRYRTATQVIELGQTIAPNAEVRCRIKKVKQSKFHNRFIEVKSYGHKIIYVFLPIKSTPEQSICCNPPMELYVIFFS